MLELDIGKMEFPLLTSHLKDGGHDALPLWRQAKADMG
jgi:hypothetical protein